MKNFLPSFSLARTGELSSIREEFSVKVSPHSLLYLFHWIPLYITEAKNLTTYFQSKGRKNFSCTCLTSTPAGVNNQVSLVFTNLLSISPQADFFNWSIFRSFCFANMVNYGVRFPYKSIHLLCMHVSTLFKSTVCVK